MPKPTTDATWEIEVSEKTGRPIHWNGQNFQYYKKPMEIAACRKDADLVKIMKEEKSRRRTPPVCRRARGMATSWICRS
ncbi:hypothetical protein PF003_g26672 [Phytophthora fragariae]|nr:hypothetical protein PF003_g26672 [Phytophthora fragariae]